MVVYKALSKVVSGWSFNGQLRSSSSNVAHHHSPGNRGRPVVVVVVAVALCLLLSWILFFPGGVDHLDQLAVEGLRRRIPVEPLTIPTAAPSPHPKALPTPPPLPKKPQLVLITPTNRPHYLSRSIQFVFPLLKCFEVRWLIIHTFAYPAAEFTPIFRDVFPWITEITAFDPTSFKGGHERNVGRDYVVTTTVGDGLVYFLDDDNTLPDLCTVLDPRELHSETMYFADQYRCGRMRLPTDSKDFGNVSNIMQQLSCKMDTGSFLIPLTLLRQSTHIMWGFRPGADAPYLGSLLKIWVTQRGPTSVQRLETLKFRYNHLSEKNDGCVRSSWSQEMLNETLSEYRELLERMTELREELPTARRCAATPEVVQHDYTHLIGVLRKMLPSRPVVYLEIGVRLGATSLFMSRQALPTHVIGVDGFEHFLQREEADRLRSSLQGNGSIDWIHSDSFGASPFVRNLLHTKYNTSTVDMLLLSGNTSVEEARADFETYAPMVAGGGYVIFDEFTDGLRGGHRGVRKALMLLIRDGMVKNFDVIGTIGNDARAGAYPRGHAEEASSVDWPRSTSKMFVLRKRQTAPRSMQKLVVVTATTKPHFLSRTLMDMIPLRKCFDVRWIIVHGVEDTRFTFTPMFSDAVPWVTEIAQFGQESWPLDVGLEYAASSIGGDGFVYVLDDANALPNLCDPRALDPSTMNPETIYYADQLRCGKMRLNTAARKFNDSKTSVHQVHSKMDTGNFLVPLQILRDASHVKWRFHRGPIFFALLINTIFEMRGEAAGPAYVRRLPWIRFNYQQQTCKRSQWSGNLLNQTLVEYRGLLEKMTSLRDNISLEKHADRQYPEVVPHEYGYILSVLRKTLHRRIALIYLEIGVGLGATSLFMSRHKLPTNVIGVDGFEDPHQLAEAHAMRAALKGEGSIDWITSDSRHAAPLVDELLQQTNTSKKRVHILLLNSRNRSEESVISDFITYEPLVAEGGYIVFDEFGGIRAGGVRRALMRLVENGTINMQKFDVLGTIHNEAGAGPYPNSEVSAESDWPQSVSKLFILWKGDGRARDPPTAFDLTKMTMSSDLIKQRMTTLDWRRKASEQNSRPQKGFGRLFSRGV